MNGFVKKTDKTPELELEKARKYKADYEKLKPRYEVISQIIEVRNKQNITQEELALSYSVSFPFSVTIMSVTGT